MEVKLVGHALVRPGSNIPQVEVRVNALIIPGARERWLPVAERTYLVVRIEQDAPQRLLRDPLDTPIGLVSGLGTPAPLPDGYA